MISKNSVKLIMFPCVSSDILHTLNGNHFEAGEKNFIFLSIFPFLEEGILRYKLPKYWGVSHHFEI